MQRLHVPQYSVTDIVSHMLASPRLTHMSHIVYHYMGFHVLYSHLFIYSKCALPCFQPLAEIAEGDETFVDVPLTTRPCARDYDYNV